MRADVREAFGTRRLRNRAAAGKGDFASDTDIYGAPKPSSGSSVALTILAIIGLLLLALVLMALFGLGFYWVMPM